MYRLDTMIVTCGYAETLEFVDVFSNPRSLIQQTIDDIQAAKRCSDLVTTVIHHVSEV